MRMKASKSDSRVVSLLENLSSEIDFTEDSLAVILAAGHGKRIKSKTSKMLHEIWGKPTAERVAIATRQGLRCLNQVIVVGIKAQEVAESIHKSDHRLFVYQEEQNGTGDAVRTALEAISEFSGDIYVFPGDMGLLSAEIVAKFKADFTRGDCDMMVLTGRFDGALRENYYGRILRVPEKDGTGASSGEDFGKVIEIKEHKDIEALSPNDAYHVEFGGRAYRFTKEELLATREFNTGVFAFKSDKLKKTIPCLRTNNVQRELYVTDLISIFNENGLSVKASETEDTRSVLGFNTKSVLKEMERYARERIYEQIKDRVMIEDKDDFFVADEVVDWIVENDDDAKPLDIYFGRGVVIGQHVRLNRDVQIGSHTRLAGQIVLGEGVRIEENVLLSAAPGQTLQIGANTRVGRGNILSGSLKVGEKCVIESGVMISGTLDTPTTIGNNVTIKGVSNILSSVIEDDILIEHSTLKFKHLRRVLNQDGTVQSVKYLLPVREGLNSVKNLCSKERATELAGFHEIDSQDGQSE